MSPDATREITLRLSLALPRYASELRIIMEIKLKIQLTVKELFNFLVAHTYSSFSGYVGVVLSICALIGFGYSVDNPNMDIAYKFVLLLTGLMFTVIQPAMLYSKAKKQVKQNESINKPLEYTISHSGIRVACDGEYADYKWEQVMKINSTKVNVLIYVNRIRAFVLPKRELGPYMEDFKKLVGEKCTASYIKLK